MTNATIEDDVRVPCADALLTGRSVVVTGGANGMGAEIVRQFAAFGAGRGAVLDLPQMLGRTAPPGWIEVGVDLRDDASVAAAFGRVKDDLDRVDALVACAGIVPPWSTIGRLDMAEWDDVMAVNAGGVLRSIRGCLPLLRRPGSIVVIASQNAYQAHAHSVSYTASKHAVLGVVRTAALEFGRSGIRVNAIAPGSIATEAYLGRLRIREREMGIPVEQALDNDRQRTVLGKLATPAEVASVAAFLVSDLAAAISGHMIPVGANVR